MKPQAGFKGQGEKWQPYTGVQPSFAGNRTLSAESLVCARLSPRTLGQPARNSGSGGGNGCGSRRQCGSEANGGAGAAGDWGNGAISRIGDAVAGGQPGVGPWSCRDAWLARRDRFGHVASRRFPGLEPQRDFAECRAGAAIMLADGGDVDWGSALAKRALMADVQNV